MIRVVNMIPRSMSGETHQDSEPNVAVDPANPQQIAQQNLTLLVLTPSLFVTFVSQPANAHGGQNIPATTVEVKDNTGAVIPGANIQMSAGNNPCNGILSGGTTALTNAVGRATFSTLKIDRGGHAYTLIATATAAGKA